MSITPLGGLLFPEHVAGIWTEERRKQHPEAPPVKIDTVYNYLRWSKPTPPGAKLKHRYADNPMPKPLAARGPRQPAWHAHQEGELRVWWHSRKGQGAKGYPKPRRNSSDGVMRPVAEFGEPDTVIRGHRIYTEPVDEGDGNIGLDIIVVPPDAAKPPVRVNIPASVVRQYGEDDPHLSA
ncbi:hypothetical protein [Micromonospora sp. NPDC007230]|uniref:hypothetical protein n=1 Tax=Micromonospora sp. NPDC007230 TaxID=3364237 RepID=UPI003685F65D